MKLPINYEKINQQQRRIVRLEYIDRQNGLCAHCNNSLSGNPSHDVLCHIINENLFLPYFFKWPVHLHHNRQTGMTIGAVHSDCNAVLWEYYGE
jgi:hypothetical protein